ncbi:hypothetical protein [Methanosarcina sp. DH1]|uniref:hypothetical protein n=1 Tax=Methanosarcina sp. DH1 TaxID=2605695 RepID=UPI001E4E8596|nr:hypothetical protein [Methanosarcina sp. DH1]
MKKAVTTTCLKTAFESTRQYLLAAHPALRLCGEPLKIRQKIGYPVQFRCWIYFNLILPCLASGCTTPTLIASCCQTVYSGWEGSCQ